MVKEWTRNLKPFRDFAQIPNSVIRDSKLSISERLMLVNLIAYAGAHNQAMPTRETLAEDFGITIRQVTRLTNALQAKGKINKGQRGWNRSNFCDFNPALRGDIDVTSKRDINVTLKTTKVKEGHRKQKSSNNKKPQPAVKILEPAKYFADLKQKKAKKVIKSFLVAKRQQRLKGMASFHSPAG